MIKKDKTIKNEELQPLISDRKERSPSRIKRSSSLFIILSLITIITTIILMTSTIAVAEAPEITNTNIPREVIVGSTAQIFFNATNATSYQILIDNEVVSQENTYNWITTDSDLGTHTIRVIAANNDGTDEDEAELTVSPKSPPMTIIEPSRTDYDTSTIPVKVSSEEADYCYYKYEENTHTLTYNEATNQYEGTISAKEGVSTINITCVKGTETNYETRTIHVDTTPPVITITKPTNDDTIENNYPTIIVITDEVTDCYYAIDEEIPNTNQTTIATLANNPESAIKKLNPDSTGTTHQTTTSRISDGNHQLNIACFDVYEHRTDASEEFRILTKPTAKISIEGDEIKKAGTYKLTVETSEPLSAIPTLTYKYQESGKSKTLSLTPNDEYDSFEGYLIIPEDQGEDVGIFSFKGTDLDGNTGTKITEGNTFLVDTVPPDKITGLEGSFLSKEQIMLSWFYEGEDDDSNSIDGTISYNIYRSTTPGVSIDNYYRSSSKKELIDDEISPGVTYYYRVAAVDRAGNTGPLSDEIKVIPNESVVVTLSPRAEQLLNDLSTRISKELLDIKGIRNYYNSLSDKGSLLIINDLGLYDDLNQKNLQLKELADKILSLRKSVKDEEEIIEEAKSIGGEVDSISNDLVTKIMVDDLSEYSPIPDDTFLREALKEYLLKNTEWTPEKDPGLKTFNKALSSLRSIVDNQDLRATIIKGRIIRNNGEEELLLVDKKFSLKEPLRKAVLLEAVPEGVDWSFSKEAGSKKLNWLLLRRTPDSSGNGFSGSNIYQSTMDNVEDGSFYYYYLSPIKNSDSTDSNDQSSVPSVSSSSSFSSTSQPSSTESMPSIPVIKSASQTLLLDQDAISSLFKEGTNNKGSTSSTDLMTGNVVGSTSSASSIFSTITGSFKDSLFLLVGVVIIAALLIYYFWLDSDDEEVVTVDPSTHPSIIPGHQLNNHQINPLINPPTTQPLNQLINQYTPYNHYYNPYQNRILGGQDLILNPGFATGAQNREGDSVKKILIKQLREDDLNNLLAEALSAAREGRVIDAKFFYKKALEKYYQESFATDELKRAAAKSLKTIYHHILLLRLKDEAYEALGAGDIKGVEQALDEMSKIASVVDGDPDSEPLLRILEEDYERIYQELSEIKSSELTSNEESLTGGYDE